MGWTGARSGSSTLVVSRTPIVAAALVPAAALLLGLVTVLVRRVVPARSLRGAALLGMNLVVVVVGVPLAVTTYPQIEHARLMSREDGWQTNLPITEVYGVRAETGASITLEGRVDRRGRDWNGAR